jgi:signal transduction histidine kinase
MRVLAVRASNGEIILLARDISEIRYLERHILIVIVISCLAIIPGVLLIGTVLSFQPLRRVQELQIIARKVAAGEFSLRMPDTGKADELDRIALTVNTMIEDVSRIVEQVKNVTDAIAHDLRTPLTRVRSRLEALRDVDQVQDTAVDALIADLDIVLERFGALLRISEIEAREQRSGFQNISLTPLVRDIVDLYQPLAEEAGIALETAHIKDLEIFADRSLLFEALNNLVDNAIKYARQKVRIAVWQDGPVAFIEIQDDGPGIPADQRHAVLRRFYRRADTRGLQGSGLGLSVVAAILHLHRFKLELSEAGPGLIAKIIMSGR